MILEWGWFGATRGGVFLDYRWPVVAGCLFSRGGLYLGNRASRRALLVLELFADTELVWGLYFFVAQILCRAVVDRWLGNPLTMVVSF